MFDRFFSMTLRRRLGLAAVLLLAPILLRGLIYYQGIYLRFGVPTPDYAGFSVPTPPGPGAADKAGPATVSSQPRIVVLDNNHSNSLELSEIEPLTTALAARGASLEVDDGSKALAARLKPAAAYVVISPLSFFSAEEIRAVRDFVAGGGRLLLFTDPTRGPVSYDLSGNPTVNPDVNAANSLAASYGLAFNNDYVYDLDRNEGNFRNVIFSDFAENALVAGLKQVVFYGAHSISTEKGTRLAVGDDGVLTSLTDSGGALSPLALSADGQVLAAGDFTFLMTPYNSVADNGTLLERIAGFALGGTRAPRLADFPYLFGREAHVLPTGDIQLTAGLLASLGPLQAAVEGSGAKFFIDEKAPREGDLIVLGTLDPADDASKYLKPFKLELAAFSQFVEVPGFGKVGRSGNGVLMYNPGTSQNTLVILTDTPEDMPTLLDKLAGGDLSSCVVQGQIAVCSVGFGGSFSDESAPPLFDLTPAGSPEPGLTPTPTASG